MIRSRMICTHIHVYTHTRIYIYIYNMYIYISSLHMTYLFDDTLNDDLARVGFLHNPLHWHLRVRAFARDKDKNRKRHARDMPETCQRKKEKRERKGERAREGVCACVSQAICKYIRICTTRIASRGV